MTVARLSHLRAKFGLTRAEFGELLGVSAADVLRWERGIPPIPDDFAVAFAAAYVQLCAEAESRRRSERRRPEAEPRGEQIGRV